MSILTSAQLSQLSASQALELHMAPKMIEAVINSAKTMCDQLPLTISPLTIDSPISLAWAIQSTALNLSSSHLENLDSIAWKDTSAFNLSCNPDLFLPSSFYEDSQNLTELYLNGIVNGKNEFYEAVLNSTPIASHSLSILDLSESPLRDKAKTLLQNLSTYFSHLENLALRGCAVDSFLLQTLIKSSSLKKIDVSDNRIQNVSSSEITKWSSQYAFAKTLPLMTQAFIQKKLSQDNPSAWTQSINSHIVFSPSVASLDTLEESTCILDLRKNPLSKTTMADFAETYKHFALTHDSLVFYNIELLLFILTDNLLQPPDEYLFKA